MTVPDPFQHDDPTTDAEQDLRELLLHLYHGPRPSPAAVEDFEGRELIVTPFDGNYGRAGFVIAVEGSPPRGAVVSVETALDRYDPAPIFYLDTRSHRLGDKQVKIVRRFLERFEAGGSTTHRIAPDERRAAPSTC